MCSPRWNRDDIRRRISSSAAEPASACPAPRMSIGSKCWSADHAMGWPVSGCAFRSHFFAACFHH
eukprot:3888363-Rhodomonas_salina.1